MLLLASTAGAYLQSRNLPVGLAATELLCFALPASLFLRHYRHTFASSPFVAPAPRLLIWTALLGLTVVLIAVAKGLTVREALHEPPPAAGSDPAMLLLLIATLPPLCEELLMRPVLQRTFAIYWTPRSAVLATALLFGLMHGSWVRFPETFILGFFCGIVYLKTGNYWICVLFHATSNALAPPLFHWAARSEVPAWLLHPAAPLLLLPLIVLTLRRLTPTPIPAGGFRARVTWLFFGSAQSGAPRQVRRRGQAVGYWATALVMIAALSAALPLELKLHPTSLATFGGPVTPENSSPFTHPFTPTARSVIINLRADTTQGYITFVLLDPHGRPIGQIAGGGLTQRGWTLPIARPGLPHTLTVTPHTARGTYQAEIFQR